jgi:hypothetical protein
MLGGTGAYAEWQVKESDAGGVFPGTKEERSSNAKIR